MNIPSVMSTDTARQEHLTQSQPYSARKGSTYNRSVKYERSS